MTHSVCTSETSVYFNETSHLYIPEGCHIHTHHHDDMKSHIKLCSFILVEATKNSLLIISGAIEVIIDINNDFI
jgi:hypothetical protein